MTRAAIYARFSKGDDERSTSIERQLTACRDYAERQGWEITETYADKITGYRDVERPDFDRLMSSLESYDVVLVFKLDRLTRRGVRDYGRAIGPIDDAGCRLISLNDHVDTSTPIGRGIVGMLLSVAEQESANISLRTKSALEARAKAGKPNKPPQRHFGYVDREYSALHPEESAAVREAARLLLEDGSSFGAIARWLNDRGLTTTKGTLWNSRNLPRYMRSPTIAGIGKMHVSTWPAIITEAQHVAIKALQSKRDRSHYHRHPFSPFLWCCCGARMVLLQDIARGETAEPDSRRRYVCATSRFSGGKGSIEAAEHHHPGSKRNGITYAPLTEHLESIMAERWPAYIAARMAEGPNTIREAIEAAEAEIARIDKNLADLAEARYVTNTIDDDRYVAAYRANADAKSKQERILAEQAHRKPIAEITYSADEMRSLGTEIIRALLGSRIVILPTSVKKHKFDVASRVVISTIDDA